MEALKLYADETQDPITMRARLRAEENILRVSQRGFVQFEESMERIHSQGLWQWHEKRYTSFREYVSIEWETSKTTAYRKIRQEKAAAAVKADESPIKTSAAEALAELDDDPDFRQRVWDMARANHEQPTGKDIDYYASLIMAEHYATIEPKTQKKVVKKQAQRLRRSAANAAKKELKAKQRGKGLRWPEKVMGLIEKMENENLDEWRSALDELKSLVEDAEIKREKVLKWARQIDELYKEMEANGIHGKPIGCGATAAELAATSKIWLKG